MHLTLVYQYLPGLGESRTDSAIAMIEEVYEGNHGHATLSRWLGLDIWHLIVEAPRIDD